MFKQYRLAIPVIIFSLAACKQPLKNAFAVTVNYSNAGKLTARDSLGVPHSASKVYLEQIVYGKEQAPLLLDSAKLGDMGTAELKANAASEGIYELVFGENLQAIPLVNDAKQIKVTADLSKKNDFYTVTGSDASAKMQSLIDDIGKKNFEIEKDFASLDSLKRVNATDSLLLPATDKKNIAISDLNNYLKTFLSSSTSPTLSLLALSWASRSFTNGEFDSTLTALTGKFPGNQMLIEMKKSFDAQKTAAASDQSAAGASWVGKPAPELEMPDLSGKNISLASFKGKYVLVDFWASWCGPCRMENPNVLKAFNKYKSKNFTILGVSLDKEKEPWQKAVTQDHLAWTQISDLKYWNSKAVETFGFQGIPFNILVDPSGKVIAQELRGEDLDSKLASVLQ